MAKASISQSAYGFTLNKKLNAEGYKYKMIVLRSLVYNFLFFATCTVFAIGLTPLIIFPQTFMQRALKIWTSILLWQLRVVVGLKHRVVGLENIPDGPAIFAGKHQSAWDTGIFHQYLEDPVFVLKQELVMIPFYGWVISRAGAIPINRKGGAKALKGMITDVGKALSLGRRVVIFPEGTRTAPGESKPYNPGVAAIYKGAGVPVVPVALNSGLFWQRRSFLKRPGIITIEFLQPIAPGLDRKEFMNELRSKIEEACSRLALEGRAENPHALPLPLPDGTDNQQ